MLCKENSKTAPFAKYAKSAAPAAPNLFAQLGCSTRRMRRSARAVVSSSNPLTAVGQ